MDKRNCEKYKVKKAKAERYTPLPSHLIFLKVHARGKFLHRRTREGLGTSEM